MLRVIQAVLGFLYVVVTVVVLYRVMGSWLINGGELNVAVQISNALNAAIVYASLFILHAVAYMFGIAPSLQVLQTSTDA